MDVLRENMMNEGLRHLITAVLIDGWAFISSVNVSCLTIKFEVGLCLTLMVKR